MPPFRTQKHDYNLAAMIVCLATGQQDFDVKMLCENVKTPI